MDPTLAESALAPKGAVSPTTGPELSLTQVGHSIGAVRVIAALDLSLTRGETVAIVGPSGCGKSTLLELVAGLAEPSSGNVSVEGRREADERLARCAYMPQRDLLLPWLSAIDNAALSPRLGGASRKSARAEAAPLFERLGLAGFESARPHELSGGMRQRVAFARTLLSGKPLLLLDEPFAGLDAITRADLQVWLLDALRTEPRTTLLVTHDVEEALFVANRALVLSPRPARVVASERAPLSAGRTRAEAVTRREFVAARERALLALSGERGA